MGKILRKITDFIIKHIGHVFFILLLIWIGMSVFLITRLYFHKSSEVVDKPIQHEEFTPPGSEEDDKKRLNGLIKTIKEPEPLEFYAAILGKGMFHQREKVEKPIDINVPEGPELEVMRITPVRIPLKYMGFIELPGGELSAQMDSAIVSVGDIVTGYKVLEITKKYVKAVKPDGGEIIFNLGEEVVSEESEAWIKDRKSSRVFRVKKSDMIGKKKVVDIKIDSVTLLNEDGAEDVLAFKRR